MLSTFIRAEIQAKGSISVARFMELALYTADLGYYEKTRPIGSAGDFYTSVSVGSLFGELLARQFSRWLEECLCLDGEVQILEAGAHDGRLALDILNWFQRHRPALLSRLCYCIIEPSQKRVAWQRQTLSQHAEHVRWVPYLESIAPEAVNGIIFANELLDAMPVHRLGWDADKKRWREWRIGCEKGEFQWQLEPLPNALLPWLPRLPPELQKVLPAQFTIECCPKAARWWHQAANILHSGRLMTLDYGFTQSELFQPERQNGTLRAYYKHRISPDIFDRIGDQDLTAHVNFSALQQAGHRAGTGTDVLMRQGACLTSIVRDCAQMLEPWSPQRQRQFATLTHPHHLGDRFRVFVQQKGILKPEARKPAFLADFRGRLR
jgi:SAM-dependent MidA family methyltransferase